ncbi:MAG TPA: FAD-dependent oxidoreductase [Burkholderiales bacterium]|nr:FAD-dependent oxidoreductase [Burkholderiales bacterium]
MSERIETPVLIVGAGPVGLTCALDLAERGIDVAVAELRAPGELSSVKCNQISARSMEIFRRLGVANALRDTGLPADYRNDVVSCTTVTGIELSRIPIPARGERCGPLQGADSWWPTPEHTLRINQTYMEPVLYARAAANSRIRFLNRTEVVSVSQNEHRVVAVARDLESGGSRSIACAYLIGCDGARSVVRKTMGAQYEGTAEIQHVQSTCIRAPDLLPMLPGKPAWLYFALNPRRCGSMISIDGRETWIVHNWLYRGETDFDAVDRDWSIRTILGVGPRFGYEVISKEDWIGRRLVADRFRDGRAFICGDAAHLWIPHAGYGMNAGIADAADLAWQIAAVLQGWAGTGMLSAYEAERHPITEQASRFSEDIARRIMRQRRGIPSGIEAPGTEGDALRAQIGRDAYALDVEQQCCAGLNFGYFYDASPVIVYDGAEPPAYSMGSYTPSTVPGCRAPHLWLDGRRSLYDALGPGYTLLRTDASLDVSAIVDASAQRRVPLGVIDLDGVAAQNAYHHKLTLVRPDQHVAWRSDAAPADPLALIDRIRGA